MSIAFTLIDLSRYRGRVTRDDGRALITIRDNNDEAVASISFLGATPAEIEVIIAAMNAPFERMRAEKQVEPLQAAE